MNKKRASLEATVSVSESEKIAKKSEINKLEQKIKLLVKIIKKS